MMPMVLWLFAIPVALCSPLILAEFLDWSWSYADFKQEEKIPMTVRAKFYVTSIQHHHIGRPDAVCAEVKLAPVYGDANKPWSEATPQGDLRMTITNPSAIDEFQLGKAYFVDFTPADKD